MPTWVMNWLNNDTLLQAIRLSLCQWPMTVTIATNVKCILADQILNFQWVWCFPATCSLNKQHSHGTAVSHVGHSYNLLSHMYIIQTNEWLCHFMQLHKSQNKMMARTITCLVRSVLSTDIVRHVTQCHLSQFQTHLFENLAASDFRNWTNT